LWFHSPDTESTRAAAAALASVVAAEGLVVALVGPLGAGKTAFAQGLAQGLGLDPADVTSPTFAIASQYVAPNGRRFAHVDLYRLGSVDELDAVGFLDLLEPGAVVAVEWGDRFPGALPRDHLRVEIEREPSASGSSLGDGEGEAPRVLNALAFGPAAEASLARWCDALALQGEGASWR
jgi:tRNA threonylcarbamoyladenosine biosynthesis protein TsaE